MSKVKLEYGNFNAALDNAARGWLKSNLSRLVTLYKDIHAHPELSRFEKRTSAIVADGLRAAGARVTDGIGGYGVAGTLENGRGPTVLVRADMDALPVKEETGLPYASAVEGVMHACGHDVHAASLTGIAAALAAARGLWRGTIVFIGQPAEELGAGAQAMVDDGLAGEIPRPDVCLALHVEAFLATGRIGYTPEWSNANVDSVDVTIVGKGGHGASPHDAADPIVAAAYFITALQTVVTRRINPLEPAVITVGSIHAGNKHNIIPERAVMQLTVRTYSDSARAVALESIRSVATDAARAAGCRDEPVVANVEATPAVYNDPALCGHAAEVFARIVGKDNVVLRQPTMGGEDFSVYPRVFGVPGLVYEVGAVKASAVRAVQRGGKPLPPLHNGRFAPVPAETIETAVRSMCALTGSLLSRP